MRECQARHRKMALRIGLLVDGEVQRALFDEPQDLPARVWRIPKRTESAGSMPGSTRTLLRSFAAALTHCTQHRLS